MGTAVGVDPCGDAQHPNAGWTVYCNRDSGHEGNHGYAGVFWPQAGTAPVTIRAILDRDLPDEAVAEIAGRMFDGDLTQQPQRVQDAVWRDARAALGAALNRLANR